MTYVTVTPKTAAAEALLTDTRDGLLARLFAAVGEVFEIPDTDIIVELNRCTTIAFHPAAIEAGAAPDVVLTFATSDTVLAPLFPALRDRVIDEWRGDFPNLDVEIWFTLIDAWGTTIPVA